MFRLFAGTGFVGLILALASLWVGASIVTSSVKALMDNCDTTYKVEVVVGGDWFCPEE
jgi:hypothetical protein